MSLLKDFVEKNKDLLTEVEAEVLSLGYYAASKLMNQKIDELSKQPRATSDINSMMCAIDAGSAIMFRDSKRGSKEKDNGDLLVLLWDYLMPSYEFVDREVTIGASGRADIIAKDENGDFVVIELKTAKAAEEKRAAEQVARYAKELSKKKGKPVATMIINETGILSDCMDVITWSELGIFSGYAYAPDGFDDGDLSDICECINVYPKQIDGRFAYPYKALWDYMYGGL